MTSNRAESHVWKLGTDETFCLRCCRPVNVLDPARRESGKRLRVLDPAVFGSLETLPVMGLLIINDRRENKTPQSNGLRGLQVAGLGFEPRTSGLCIPLQLPLPGIASLWSGLSLHPRLVHAGRVLAIKSLHLLRSLSSELGSGLPPPGVSPTLASFTHGFPRVQPIAGLTPMRHENRRILAFVDAARPRPCEFRCRSR